MRWTPVLLLTMAYGRIAIIAERRIATLTERRIGIIPYLRCPSVAILAHARYGLMSALPPSLEVAITFTTKVTSARQETRATGSTYATGILNYMGYKCRTGKAEFWLHMCPKSVLASQGIETQPGPQQEQVRILSRNIRGIRSNLSAAIRHNAIATALQETE